MMRLLFLAIDSLSVLEEFQRLARSPAREAQAFLANDFLSALVKEEEQQV